MKEDIFLYAENRQELVGIYRPGGESLIPCTYNYIYCNSNLFIAYTKIGTQTNILNSTGELLFALFNASYQYFPGDSTKLMVNFHGNGKVRSRSGLIDLQLPGYIIPPNTISIYQYQFGSNFAISWHDTGTDQNPGNAHRKRREWWIVNSDLKAVSPMPFYHISVPDIHSDMKKHGLFIGQTDSGYAIFDHDARRQVNSYYDYLTFFNDTAYIVRHEVQSYTKRDTFGIIDARGRYLLSPFYHHIQKDQKRRSLEIENMHTAPPSSMVIVSKDRSYGVVQFGDKVLAETVYAEIILYDNVPLARVRMKNGPWGYINLLTGVRYFQQ
jgi:hypothetical protein